MALLGHHGGTMENKKIINHYLSYLSNYKGSIALLLFLSLASAGTAIPIPAIYAHLVDKVIPNKDIETLFVMAGLLLALLALNAIISYVLTLVGSLVRKKFRSQMRSISYSKLQRLPYEQLSHFVSGDLVSRLTRDLDSLGVLLPKGIAEFIKNILIIIGIVSIMLHMSWKLTLISGIMIPLFFLFFLCMMKTLEERAKKNHETKGKLQASLQEKIEGNRDIQLTNSYEHQHQSATKIIQESESVLTHLNFHEAKMGLVFSLFPILGSGLLWGLGGYWSITNVLTLGEVIAFSYAFNYLFDPISSVFSTISEVPIELTALQRIFELFPENQQTKILPNGNKEAFIRGKIDFKKVSFGYENSPLLLQNLNFSIKPGTVTCIVGENGIGKSTLFSLLLYLYQVNQGQILIDGHPVQSYSEATLRKNISLVPQQAFLFQGSIKDNIIMGRKVSEQDFNNACELSGVFNLVKKFDKGVESLVTEKGNNLSGGEKQKIAIARALVENPSVLLLDEPTNNLDEAIKASIQQSLLLAKAGKTIILITHDLSFIEGITEIYEIKDKKIIKKEHQHA
ncbi:MAG: hypothetical protein CL521_05895 [Actinobacteria bacterium]|nr:hypothetical protein [Actinomycetota bacterium]